MSDVKFDRALPAVAGGVAWKFATQTVAYGSRAVITIILARLLTPTDFGLAGLALLFSSLVLVFADLGASLVHLEDLDDSDRTTAFWLSLSAGCLLALTGVAASGLIADFFNEPDVQPLMAILSLSFVLTAATTVPGAILSRRLAFRQIELSNLAAVLVAAGAAVLIAFLGGGPWAIIFQYIVQSTVFFIVLWTIVRWRPTFSMSWRSVKRVGGYSLNVIGTKLFQFAQTNADSILIGRFLGPTSLGVYSLAYNLMLFPVLRITDPISAALFPVLSRLQRDLARVAAIWLRVTRFVASVVAPMMLFLIVLDEEFVHVVLGHKWDAAIPVVRILAWAGFMHTLTGTSSSVLYALGRTRQMLIYHACLSVVMIGGFLVAVQYGIVEVAIAYSGSITLLAPVYILFTARGLKTSLWGYLRNLAGVLGAALIASLVAIAVRTWLVSADASDLVVLLTVIGVALPVYGVLARLLNPGLMDDLRSLIQVVRRRSGSAVLAPETGPDQGTQDASL